VADPVPLAAAEVAPALAPAAAPAPKVLLGPERTEGWLDTMLSPQSVAVVGASEANRSPGGRLIRALVRYGFAGRVYPVNPGRDTILGLRCYPAIAALPEVPDVAVIVVAAAQSVGVLAECARLGIGNVIIGSSGYAETGPEGAAIQEQLADIARAHGIVLVGPNTNGIISCGSRFTASFTPALQQDSFQLQDGPVAVVSQSGALGASFFYLAQRDGLGAGTLINTGNEVDVRSEDVIAALASAASPVSVILAYNEGLRDAALLASAARTAVSSGTTIAMLKVGITASGAEAAAAHTANLAGEDRVFSGVLRQLGIIRARSSTELVDVGRVLAACGPRLGDRVTIASMSGGLGIMLTDAAASSDLRLASWPAEQQRALDGLLPDYLSRANPIDVAGAPFFDLDVLEALLHAMDDNPHSDVAVLAVCNFEQLQDAIAARITAVRPDLRKPLFVVWLGGEDAVRRLNRAGIPSFPDSDRCIRAISLVAGRRPGSIVTSALPGVPSADLRITGATTVGRAVGAGDDTAGMTSELAAALADPSDTGLLERFGIPAVRSRIVAGPDRANDASPDGAVSAEAGPEPAGVAAALAELRLPVVAKLLSTRLPHKSDAGAVLLDLRTPDAVADAVVRLSALRTEIGAGDGRIVLQEQAGPGLELLLGMKHDPVFGPVVMLGIGGIYAEAFDDVQIRLPWLNRRDAADMVGQLAHRRLLSGFRGGPAADIGRLAAVLTGFARLVREVGQHFTAIDINPIILPADGGAAVAVDWLLVPKPRAADGNAGTP
jgi:acetate---CoA ligase (ADP-forming)